MTFSRVFLVPVAYSCPRRDSVCTVLFGVVSIVDCGRVDLDLNILIVLGCHLGDDSKTLRRKLHAMLLYNSISSFNKHIITSHM